MFLDSWYEIHFYVCSPFPIIREKALRVLVILGKVISRDCVCNGDLYPNYSGMLHFKHKVFFVVVLSAYQPVLSSVWLHVFGYNFSTVLLYNRGELCCFFYVANKVK